MNYASPTRRDILKLRLARQVAEILQEVVNEQIEHLDEEIEFFEKQVHILEKEAKK
jgi:hypothetical protein